MYKEISKYQGWRELLKSFLRKRIAHIQRSRNQSGAPFPTHSPRSYRTMRKFWRKSIWWWEFYTWSNNRAWRNAYNIVQTGKFSVLSSGSNWECSPLKQGWNQEDRSHGILETNSKVGEDDCKGISLMTTVKQAWRATRSAGAGWSRTIEVLEEIFQVKTAIATIKIARLPHAWNADKLFYSTMRKILEKTSIHTQKNKSKKIRICIRP